MQLTKRAFLKGSVALMAVAALPRILWAAVWPEKTFNETTMKPALVALFGTDVLTASDKNNPESA